MKEEKTLRPGGRSARVQQAVHRSVCEIQKVSGREGLTVTAIAAGAGVTPSTIYRRWGDLPQLLSDVAVEHFRPEADPVDTGSFHGDLLTWLEQYHEEITSRFGRVMLCDVLSSPESFNAGQCAQYLTGQFEIIRQRAISRGETPLTSALILDCVISPIIFRILFTTQIPEFDFVLQLIQRTFSLARKASADTYSA